MESVFSALFFLLAINGTPFLAQLVFAERLNWPVDGGKCWRDGRRLLGDHKTFRGLFVSLSIGTLFGPIIGLTWIQGAIAAFLAMAGDLITSFVKRRMSAPPGEPIFGFDQLIESMFPISFLIHLQFLVLWQGSLTLLLFITVAFLASRFLIFSFYRPPLKRFLRIVHHPTRFREWRACHEPLARWQRWFNFENYVFYRGIIHVVFRALGLYQRGVENVLAVGIRHQSFSFGDLPRSFDRMRILYMSDLHLDGVEGLTESIASRIEGLEVDLCVFGGDLRMEIYGSTASSLRKMKWLLQAVHSRHGVYGVLGNHDCIEMLPEFEAAGVRMLVNEAVRIDHFGESVWLVGVDDPHYYRCHDLDAAYQSVPKGGFSIFLAHSPEVYREAACRGARLYLCGHTHGGQICLPKFGPIFTHCRAPRRLAAGEWSHAGMRGYTSRGAGASGVPIRFNCPGEITVITLRSEEQNTISLSDLS